MATSKSTPVPQVRNIADLKSTPRNVTLIHFSAEQWKGAIKGVKEARSIRKGRSFIEYIPLPDGGGIIHADCGSPSPTDRCSVRPVVDLPRPVPPQPGPGPRPGPELSRLPEQVPVRFECTCRPASGGGSKAPVVLKPPCELIIERAPRLRITCRSNSCSGRCVLTIVRDGLRFRISCECS